MQVNIKIEGLDAALSALDGFSSRRMNAALATALNNTADQIKPALQREMSDVFDRPTRFTLNSIYTRRASASDLTADVGIKDDLAGVRPAQRWLRWQVYGGERTLKAFESLLVHHGFMRSDQRAVPGAAARLDGFGNFSRGQLQQILSQLRIDAGAGSTRAMARIEPGDNAKTIRAKQHSIRKALGRAGGRFVALPNGTRTLPPGIYLNEGKNFGSALGFGASRRLRPVVIFVSTARYEKGRFDFFDVAERQAARLFGPAVERAIADQVVRLASKA